MNPEPPQTPRDETEIRITALLMGELAPEEAAALETQIAADPQLAALCTRLRHAIALLGESRIPNPPLQLSAGRRARLLAAFQGVATPPAPAPLKNKRPGNWKTFIPLGLAALLLALIGVTLLLPASSSFSSSPWRRNESLHDRFYAVDFDGSLQTESSGMSDPAEAIVSRLITLADEGSKPERNASGAVEGVRGTADVSPAAPVPNNVLGWQSQPGAIRNFSTATLASDKSNRGGIYLPPLAQTDGLVSSSSIQSPKNLAASAVPAEQIERLIVGGTFTANGGVETLTGKASELTAYRGSTTAQNTGSLGVTHADTADSRWRFGGSKEERSRASSPSGGGAEVLNLFAMPVVEPHAISEPLSTAGKIVLNSELKPSSNASAPSRPASPLAGIELELDLAEEKKVAEILRSANVETPAPQMREGDHQRDLPIPDSSDKPDALNDDFVLGEKGTKDSAKRESWFGQTDGGVATEGVAARTKGNITVWKEGNAIGKDGGKANANTASEGSYWDTPQAEQLAKAKSPARRPVAATSVDEFEGFYVSRGLAERSEPMKEELTITGTTTLGRTRERGTRTNKGGVAGLPGSMNGRMDSGSAPEKPTSTPSPAAPAGAAVESTPEAAGEKQEKLLAQKMISRPPAKLAEQPALPALIMAEPALVKDPQPAPVPQPEVRTKTNAFSTFSLNVSDVSFKLASASLEKGAMPEAASVRTEEFINAFDYRDPEPAAGAPLAFACERARSPFAQNRDLLRLSVKTAAAGRQPGRPLNLVLLLDNSGSMERADRVRIVHEALRVLAAQLQPQDVLSIIAFARTPRLWADGVAGDKASEVTQRVGEIAPQGGTDIAAALDLGYQTALRHYKTGSVNRVVMLTDGAANLGDVSPAALKQKVEAHRQQGVALDCFGVGWEGYNDDLLEQLARNGDGRYGFLNTPEGAATEFAAQLAGALRVAASDVKVQVEFNPRRVTSYRQLGYAKHQLKKEQFRDNTVDAAEIGAAESGNALYAVEVDPRGEGDLATVRVRFKVPGTGDYREHEWVVPFTAPAPPLEHGASSLRLAACAAAFSEWLVASPHAGEVTTDRLLALLNGIPAIHGADERPAKLEWMIRQAKSLSGR